MATDTSTKHLLLFRDDARLGQLEDVLTRFNLFEAIGATNEELRHSNFLGFLLDPNKSHGLGDRFVEGLLRRVIPEIHDSDTFTGVRIFREYRFIDILIIDTVRNIAVIIENKIWSGETGNQLQTYWNLVKEEFPHLQRFGILLTPRGQKASHSEYRSVSYGVIAEILDGIVLDEDGGVPPDVKMGVRHYVEILRRFIVGGNADTGELARQLYIRHKQAIEQMNPTNWQRWIKSYLEGLIEASSDVLDLDERDIANIRFGLRRWDTNPALMSGQGWTKSNRIALFQFYNFPDSLTLHLFVGPGPEEVRQRLYELCRRHKPTLIEPRRASKWWQVYNLALLESSDYAKCSDQELREKIDIRWDQFLKGDFHRIREIFVGV
jgi:hypothetical protein